MNWYLKRKRGKDYLVLDTRPSKAIRKANRRIQKRMKEIHNHLSKKAQK